MHALAEIGATLALLALTAFAVLFCIIWFNHATCVGMGACSLPAHGSTFWAVVEEFRLAFTRAPET